MFSCDVRVPVAEEKPDGRRSSGPRFDNPIQLSLTVSWCGVAAKTWSRLWEHIDFCHRHRTAASKLWPTLGATSHMFTSTVERK